MSLKVDKNLTLDTASTLFSVRLTPELALYVRQSFENYNIFIRALIQSYKDGRIDRDQVMYEER